VWFILAVPICILLANSLAFVVWVSVYAVVIGHFSAWQAARAEIEAQSS
jgi:ABC-type Fe3+ transport system permease subunit